MKKQLGMITAGVIFYIAGFAALMYYSDPVGKFPWEVVKVECELPDGKPGYCDEDGNPLE